MPVNVIFIKATALVQERELKQQLGEMQERYKGDVENMGRELELVRNKVRISMLGCCV